MQDWESIDTGSLVDRVEKNIVRLLQEQKLKVGDIIPKEADLAVSLGVSRTVIREAMLRLRLMGLIESKKKIGAVITNPDVFGILGRSLNPYILSDEALREMFEIRLVLEVGMADLLCKRVAVQDIEVLRTIVSFEPPVTRNYLFTADHEVAFHGKLYEIAGNDALKKFQRLLLPVFDYVHNSGMLKKQVDSAPFISHSDLVDILETRHAARFREAMHSHLAGHFERLPGGSTV